MGSYVKVLNGVVVDGIRADASFFDTFVDSSPGTWLQTSYNTRGGVYYLPDLNTPDPDQSKAFRANFAGLGYTYDPVNDVFYAPQPFPSWSISAPSWLWEAPTPMPAGGPWAWDEATQSWVAA
jgi:hypothetical protein